MSNDWAQLLMTDHETTERVLEAASRALAAEAPSIELVTAAMDYLTGYADQCHNRKEETHVFPLLESRGIPRSGGPLGVMLQEHEQSRELLARLEEAAAAWKAGDPDARPVFRDLFEQYAELLKNHYWKENDILFPMGRRVMTPADAASVVEGIRETEESFGPDTRQRYYALAARIVEGGGVEDLSFGVEREVLAAILNTLPVELSFVDHEDRVRYFSHENGTKIFPRTRGVIGMPVQQCHPEKSVHLVNKILADFKAGRRSVAEFWIDLAGRKVHIRYFPVRGAKNEYLGCLEVVQDITAIQELRGQKRLLDDVEAATPSLQTPPAPAS